MPVSTIAAEKPFLPTLATYIASRLQEDASFSRALILLPSRRACRSLQEHLLEQSHGRALLLPQILPIGEITEATAVSDITVAIAKAEIPPAISTTERIMLLTRLIAKRYEEDEQTAYNFVQSVHLATELATLFDELERQRFPLDALRTLVPEEYAEHWQLTLDFLSIYLESWPKILRDRSAMDVMQRRNLVLDAIAKHWTKSPPNYPIIIAGSTASNTSTREFIKLVAGFNQTHIILPGLDMQMNEKAWNAVNATHAQYHLRLLLQTLKLERKDVALLSPSTVGGGPGWGHSKPESNNAPLPASPLRWEENHDRYTFISNALLPPDITDSWQTSPYSPTALQGLHELNCSDSQQEAEVIALITKKHRVESDHSICIVTEDRQLAKRISIACQALGVEIDDSGGVSLIDAAPAVFLMLLITAAEQNSLLSLLPLLQHPLATAGLNRKEVLETARWLDFNLIRHPNASYAPPSISGVLKLRNVTESVKNVVSAWHAILEPLRTVLAKRTAVFTDILQVHINTAQLASKQLDASGVWNGDSGEALQEYLNELSSYASHVSYINPQAYGGMLEAILGEKPMWVPYHAGAKVRVLSPMEARLETADVMILAGLNEGSWPRILEPSPWMSRAMQRKLSMDLPEATISRSAHDFYMLMHAPHVYMTRAHMVDAQLMEPSRWLQRMHSYLTIQPGAKLDNCEEIFAWWKNLRQMDNEAALDLQAPVPPVEVRPRKLTASDIELLQRDPYAIYAKHILKLRPLELWDREAEASHFGNLVHATLEEFTQKYPQMLPPDALAELSAMGHKNLAQLNLNPLTQKLWGRRWIGIVEWLIAQEHERRSGICEVQSEKTLEVQGIYGTLKARIDRIEKLKDGTTRIIDYKTGSVPSAGDVLAGVACQLPLEAWMLERLEPGSKVSSLEYWKLSGRNGQSEIKIPGGKAGDVERLKQQAATRVGELFAHYFQPETGYPICPDDRFAPKYNNFAHLERLAEIELEGEED